MGAIVVVTYRTIAVTAFAGISTRRRSAVGLEELDHSSAFYVGVGDEFDDDRRIVPDGPLAMSTAASPREGS